jgi:hypothetical protein
MAPKYPISSKVPLIGIQAIRKIIFAQVKTIIPVRKKPPIHVSTRFKNSLILSKASIKTFLGIWSLKNDEFVKSRIHPK